MLIKFLLNSKDLKRSAYVWNTATGLLIAAQSVVMLILVSYTISLQSAGILSIAYANANLLQYIGKWGMRQYQVSDVCNEYSFTDYRNSRIVSCGLMTLVSIVVIIHLVVSNDYTVEKVLIVSFMCAFKILDPIEEVFSAHYQKNGRLDIGSKCASVRIGSSLILFAIVLVICKSVLIALIIMTAYSAIAVIILMKITFPMFANGDGGQNHGFRVRNVFNLLGACFPIFMSAFLQNYISNAPKYAIDSAMDDASQAYFGYLFSPVFVIVLLASFIFNPILLDMSLLWKNHEKKAFTHRVIKQLGYIFLITIGVVIVGYVIGLRVLSILYNTNLMNFRSDFMILLATGGFLAVSSLSIILLTIIRKQGYVLAVYIVAAICAMLFSTTAVESAGIHGAVMFYALLTGAIFIVLLAILIKQCHTYQKK
ncbi:MAG: hypothetical protein LBN34_06015 [Clostridiales Family XIII bacterium]|nr:hypothetical protein [Clostridiales Family XIII bacterium]